MAFTKSVEMGFTSLIPTLPLGLNAIISLLVVGAIAGPTFVPT